MVLEKTLNSFLDCKEVKSVNPKGNQPLIYTWRSDADAEALILWLPDGKSQLFGKDPHAEQDWRQEEKGLTEDEMVGRHHPPNGHEFEQNPGDSVGQGNFGAAVHWVAKSWTGLSDWTAALNTKRFKSLNSFMLFIYISGGSDGKESACNVGNLGSIPGLARSPGEGNGHLFQYFGLENSTDRGAWQATVHGVVKSRKWLSNFHFHIIHKYILPQCFCFCFFFCCYCFVFCFFAIYFFFL